MWCGFKPIVQFKIFVFYRLPEDVLFCEEPLVARWDHKKKQWRQDGFTDPKYNEGNLITKKTSKRCTFTKLHSN